MRRWLPYVLLLLVVAAPLRAQTPTLAGVAEEARRAWAAHDVAGLVASGGRIVVQLPTAAPTTALGQAQAAALLRDYLQGAEEVEVRVAAAREIQERRGFVELVRRYRVRGTQEVRSETVLLSYRLAPGGWALVELRIG